MRSGLRPAAKKHEKRLLKKVLKHLADSILALDVRLREHKRSTQDILRREILDPPKRERAITFFLRFTNQAERGLQSKRPPSHLNRMR